MAKLIDILKSNAGAAHKRFENSFFILAHEMYHSYKYATGTAAEPGALTYYHGQDGHLYEDSHGEVRAMFYTNFIRGQMGFNPRNQYGPNPKKWWNGWQG